MNGKISKSRADETAGKRASSLIKAELSRDHLVTFLHEHNRNFVLLQLGILTNEVWAMLTAEVFMLLVESMENIGGGMAAAPSKSAFGPIWLGHQLE